MRLVLFQHERLRKGLSQPCQNGVYVLLRNRHQFLLRRRIMADRETSATREQRWRRPRRWRGRSGTRAVVLGGRIGLSDACCNGPPGVPRNGSTRKHGQSLARCDPPTGTLKKGSAT